MKIQSMTGFGKAELKSDPYFFGVEIKSVNNRFKEIRFRLPSLFNSFEMTLREQVLEKFERGSFDLSVVFNRHGSKSGDILIDWSKVNSFLEESSQKMVFSANTLNISPTDFLRNEFFLEPNEKEKKQLLTILNSVVAQSVEQLILSREQEGEKLLRVIELQLKLYSVELEKLESQAKEFSKEIEAKLKSRFLERAKELPIEEGRFSQELIYYLEKIDIEEEIQRAKIHLGKIEKLLNQGGPVGRQLEFYLQELNRETNTMGSKSANTNITTSVVEMKVCLEKIREQALNLV